MQNVFVPNYKLYLSQTANCICPKLQTVFANNKLRYFDQVAGFCGGSGTAEPSESGKKLIGKPFFV